MEIPLPPAVGRNDEREHVMNGNSKNHGGKRALEDVLEEEPQSKHGTEGEAVHGGDQAGPNSADAGRREAPQTGDPMNRSH
jgi:hypothetical protein